MRRAIPRGSHQHLIRMVHLQILCQLQRESPLPLSEACFGYIEADFMAKPWKQTRKSRYQTTGQSSVFSHGPLKAARVVEAPKHHTSVLSGECCQWPAGKDDNSFMTSWIQVLEMPYSIFRVLPLSAAHWYALTVNPLVGV